MDKFYDKHEFTNIVIQWGEKTGDSVHELYDLIDSVNHHKQYMTFEQKEKLHNFESQVNHSISEVELLIDYFNAVYESALRSD